MTRKIDWKRLWKQFDRWSDRTSMAGVACYWEHQKRAIRRMVEAQLKRSKARS